MSDPIRDLPFFYVQYLSAATFGLLTNSQIPLTLDRPFLLRRCVLNGSLRNGPAEPKPSSFQAYDSESRSITGLLGDPTITDGSELTPPNTMFLNEVIIAPEVTYPRGSSLKYDVNFRPIIPIVGSNPDELRAVGFMGVHRFDSPVNPAPFRKGNWYERRYAYIQNVSLSTPGTSGYLTANQSYSIEIRNWDFELRRILIVDLTKSLNGLTAGTMGYSMGGMFAYVLQNANQQNMMNAPVPDWFIAANTNYVSSFFPTPGIIYPVGSQINFTAYNIWAQTGGALAQSCSQQIIFEGVNRYPCS